jgi:hypothetical protein
MEGRKMDWLNRTMERESGETTPISIPAGEGERRHDEYQREIAPLTGASFEEWSGGERDDG